MTVYGCFAAITPSDGVGAVADAAPAVEADVLSPSGGDRLRQPTSRRGAVLVESILPTTVACSKP